MKYGLAGINPFLIYYMIKALHFMMLAFLVNSVGYSQTSEVINMKLNAGIITAKLEATKSFYQNILKFGVTFENEFYVLMHTPDHQYEISFLLPKHPSQKEIFQTEFNGKGVYLTIEVDDVNREYNRIKSLGIPVKVELRDEPWGDRHFAIVDPNGIGIDIVTYYTSEK